MCQRRVHTRFNGVYTIIDVFRGTSSIRRLPGLRIIRRITWREAVSDGDGIFWFGGSQYRFSTCCSILSSRLFRELDSLETRSVAGSGTDSAEACLRAFRHLLPTPVAFFGHRLLVCAQAADQMCLKHVLHVRPYCLNIALWSLCVRPCGCFERAPDQCINASL